MRNEISESHFIDANGPAGGTSYGIGFAISWQNGPLGRGEERRAPNGAFVEDLISAVIGRLYFYQNVKRCEENSEALVYLHKALDALQRRTARREAEGVEGTHEGS